MNDGRMIMRNDGDNIRVSGNEVFEFCFHDTKNGGDCGDVFRTAGAPFTSSSSVSRIFSSTYFVCESDHVGEIIDSFNIHTSLLAIGVVDDNCKSLGVIVRRELFNLISREIGKEILMEMSAAKVMREAEIFNESASLFAVSATVHENMSDPEIRYYLAVNSEGKFSGVFSTRDILVHLANMSSKDIETARMIQSSIVAEDQSYIDEKFTISCHSTMAMGVGGDFYLVKNFAPDRYHLSIADVSGKGISASLVTAIACGMATTYNFRSGLSGFVRGLNNYVLSTFNSEKFITGIFMELNTRLCRLNLYDMGHSFILFLRRGRFCSLRGHTTNYPLGIGALENLQKNTIGLESGDILFISTDGVTEQTDSSGEQFGEKRLRNVIAANRENEPQKMAEEIKTAVRNFRASQPQKDDLTFMIFRWN